MPLWQYVPCPLPVLMSTGPQLHHLRNTIVEHSTDAHNRSYRTLTPRTRILIGAGVMAYAGFGLLVSDKAEQAFGYTASEEDKQRLREAVPRVHLVDREGIGSGK